QVEAPKRGAALSAPQVAFRAALGGLAGFALGLLTLAALEAMRTYRAKKLFDLGDQIRGALTPSGLGGWLTLAGLVALSLTVALTTAAAVVARRGPAAGPLGIDPPPQASNQGRVPGNQAGSRGVPGSRSG